MRAVSRIAEAPISLAATICFSRVTKSFLSIGRSVSSTTSRSIWSSPPNQRPVTTDRHGAPAATYSETICEIGRSPIRSTSLPSRRLTSMISGMGASSNAWVNGLGIGPTTLPRRADLVHPGGTDLAVGAARVGVDVDAQEERIRSQLLELVAVGRR